MNRENFLRSVSVIDTETTHIDVHKAEIIEVAGGSWGRGTWHVNNLLLGSVAPIPPEASATHHISNHMIKGLPTFVENHKKAALVLGCDKTWWVAHNSSYDQAVLSAAWKNSGEVDLAELCAGNSRWICTYRLARHVLQKDFPDMKFNLSYLRYRLDLAVPDHHHAHRADADVITCALLLELLMDYAVDSGRVSDQSDLGTQLHELCWSPIAITEWPFGKHRGVLLSELATSYYLWALENIDALKEGTPVYDTDLATSVAQELEKRLTSTD